MMRPQSLGRLAFWCLLGAGTVLPVRPVRAVYNPFPLPDPSRRWGASLASQIGYDDNINTTLSGKKDSLTSHFEPQLIVNFPQEQTFLGLRYTYGATYYFECAGDQLDSSHSGEVLFSHTFSPRLSLDLRDRVVRGIAPELVETAAGVPLITRRRGDYLYNDLGGTLSYGLGSRWSVFAGGGWQLWNYDDQLMATENDRNGYRGMLSVAYAFRPRTSFGFGYEFQETDYRTPGVRNARNTQSHIAYGTIIERFNPKLTLQLNGGLQLSEFGDGTSDSAPWASASATYNYAPESALTAGFSYQISTTEVGAYRSADTASGFLRIEHHFTKKVRASANAAFSVSTFSNPTPGFFLRSGLEERGLFLGLNLTYEFSRWLSANAGYTFDQVVSDVAGRAYDRNRFSLGLRFVY
jgi:hypothetical protein